MSQPGARFAFIVSHSFPAWHDGTQLGRGEGVPPPPSHPSQGAPWDIPLIGSLPSHVTFFLYKKRASTASEFI